MFKKITAAITCAAATMLGAACAAPAPNATSSDLDAAAVIVDVRSAAEHASGHVKGDILVPVDELEARVDEVSAKAGGKDKVVVVYCASGRRSARAKAILESKGFTNVKDAGGFSGLKSAYPDRVAQ